MMSWVNGEKMWLVIILVLGALIGAAFAYVSGIRLIINNWQVLTQAHRDSQALEKRHRDIFAARRSLADLDTELQLIRSSFVNPSEPLPFIQSIEDMGRRDGVNVELALGHRSPGRDYDISVTGSFHRVASFLKHLESLPFMIELGEVKFSSAGLISVPPGAKASEPLVNLTVAVYTVAP